MPGSGIAGDLGADVGAQTARRAGSGARGPARPRRKARGSRAGERPWRRSRASGSGRKRGPNPL